MNKRSHFFSEGIYDILGAPPTDDTDAISWMASQPGGAMIKRTPNDPDGIAAAGGTTI